MQLIEHTMQMIYRHFLCVQTSSLAITHRPVLNCSSNSIASYHSKSEADESQELSPLRFSITNQGPSLIRSPRTDLLSCDVTLTTLLYSHSACPGVDRALMSESSACLCMCQINPWTIEDYMSQCF